MRGGRYQVAPTALGSECNCSLRYMITGSVLLLAVIIDSMSRRSRRAAGWA
ncbi:hypothetical protein ACIGB6_06735 [Paeniglutamicibacter gangotriensis]|uniref:hypothetical protein n=1 Tax=Paeniglutamicibacter gangotriensis TaxID=254787 RepID=UPI000347AAD6|nr:hypothetical protein [Paeniglutamicibacter gangotriensis]